MECPTVGAKGGPSGAFMIGGVDALEKEDVRSRREVAEVVGRGG
jgi:hypothetical protein